MGGMLSRSGGYGQTGSYPPPPSQTGSYRPAGGSGHTWNYSVPPWLSAIFSGGAPRYDVPSNYDPYGPALAAMEPRTGRWAGGGPEHALLGAALRQPVQL